MAGPNTVPTVALFTGLLNTLKVEIEKATGRDLKGEEVGDGRSRFRHFILTADIKQKIKDVVTLWGTAPQRAVDVLVEVTQHFRNKQVKFLRSSTIPNLKVAIDDLQNVSEDDINDIRQMAWELEQYVSGETFDLDEASKLYWELVENLEAAQEEGEQKLQAQSQELLSQFAELVG